MVWTAPATWTAAAVTVASMNVEVRDHLIDLDDRVNLHKVGGDTIGGTLSNVIGASSSGATVDIGTLTFPSASGFVLITGMVQGVISAAAGLDFGMAITFATGATGSHGSTTGVVQTGAAGQRVTVPIFGIAPVTASGTHTVRGQALTGAGGSGTVTFDVYRIAFLFVPVQL